MKFQVCGFKCSRTRRLVESCSTLIEQLQDQSILELLEDADLMNKMGIKNTPALIVDGQILFQGCAMSPEGIREMLKKNQTTIQP